MVRHVVDMSQDNPQQLLRTKHHVLVRNERPEKRDREMVVVELSLTQ